MQGTPLSYRYTTSLHWSLTQFTPASMEVTPENTTERVFSVVVLLFAMITFSSFVSMLTASMGALKNLSSDESRQFWLLRRYLRDWSVSRHVGLRIQRYLEYVYNQQRQRVQGKDVQLLVLLSKPLRDELTHETLAVHLKHHQLFYHCDTRMRVFSSALSEVSLARSDTLFSCGEQAAAMYFVGVGVFQYQLGEYDEQNGSKGSSSSHEPQDAAQHESEHDPEDVVEGQWISEAALWCPWLHMGDLQADTECKVVTINASTFGDHIKQNKPMFVSLCRYAESFVRMMNRIDPTALTDLLHRAIDVGVVMHNSEFQKDMRHSHPFDDFEETSFFQLGQAAASLVRRTFRPLGVFSGGPSKVQPKPSMYAEPHAGEPGNEDKCEKHERQDRHRQSDDSTGIPLDEMISTRSGSKRSCQGCVS